MAIGIVCGLYILFRIVMEFYIMVIGNLIVKNVGGSTSNTTNQKGTSKEVKVMSEKEKYYFDKYGI